MDRVRDVLAHHVTLDRNAERTPYRLLLVEIMAGAIHAIDPAEPSRLATVRLGTWVSATARALAGSVFAVVPGVRGLAGPVARLPVASGPSASAESGPAGPPEHKGADR